MTAACFGPPRSPGRMVLSTVTSLALWAGCAGHAASQELTPRAYWPAPKGTRVAVVGYSYVAGNVLVDPSTPISGVTSKVHAGVLAYLQTFSLWGRTANLVVEVPFSRGRTEGFIGDLPARRDVSGLGDLAVALSVNLIGAPTMTPAGFQALRAAPRPILGGSLRVVAPTGRYEADRLINVGANRWAARLELGSIMPLSPPWLLELDGGAWLYGDDDEFLAGYREQDPVFELQVHLVRRFKPGLWASLDVNYFAGGRQTIGGEELAAVHDNSRIGITVAVPFERRHAVKIGYFRGLRTEAGSEIDQLLMSYQVLIN